MDTYSKTTFADANMLTNSHAKRERYREAKRHARAAESDEARAARRARDAARKAKKRAEESPEVRAARLANNAACMAKLRKGEVPETRAARLANQAACVTKMRAEETPEMRSARLARNAACMRARRWGGDLQSHARKVEILVQRDAVHHQEVLRLQQARQDNCNLAQYDDTGFIREELRGDYKQTQNLPQQHVCKEEEVLADQQQLCVQEKNSSLEQEDPEPPQIKEELEGEQLVLNQETDTFMLTLTHEERDHSEGQTQNFNADKKSEADKESVVNTPVISRSHSNNVDNPNLSEMCEKQYLCETCGKRFCDIKTHMTIHTGERPYSCKTCGKDFRLKHLLKGHIRIHTGEKPYLCKTCGKTFSDSSALKTHVSIHTGERPYSCKLCGKHFRLRNGLKVHMKKAHTGEKPYLCKTCGKGFIHSVKLKTHVSIHTGERPYSCKLCGKNFRLHDFLKVHVRNAHTGEKPYLCKTCGKGFLHRSKLETHVSIHTGERPYACKLCGKDFRLRGGLEVHVRKAHTDEKPF